MRPGFPVLLPAAFAVLLAGPAVAQVAEDAERRVLVPADASWRLLEGREPYPESWREPDFDDSAWREGPAGIGYGDGDDATVLEDMAGSYWSVALRHEFRARFLDSIAWLELRVDHDDGFVAWINGVEVARARLEGDPPAHDAPARNHEAGTWSAFEVPRELLRRGRNVLAVQVHNADLHSSDLSLRAELLGRVLERPDDPLAPDEEPPRLAAEPEGAAGGWSLGHELRLGAGRISNYFQARAGSPKEEVVTGLLGYELELERRRADGVLLRVRAGVETERFDGLGETKVLDSRFERRTGRTRFDARARLKLDRPAFRLSGQLATSDTLSLGAAWTWRFADPVAWELAADWVDETNDRDPLRENEQLALSAALRFLPGSRTLSPELGVERGRLRARDDSFDHDQWRVRLQLISKPGRTTYLSLLLRWTDREYATGDAAAGNFGRSDRRRLVRGLVAWRPSRLVGVVGWSSWEDGDSSRPNRAFENWTAWAGLSLHF